MMKKRAIPILIVSVFLILSFILIQSWLTVGNYNKKIDQIASEIDAIKLIAPDLNQLLRLNNPNQSTQFVNEILAASRNAKISVRPNMKVSKNEQQQNIHTFNFEKLELKHVVEFIYQIESISPAVQINKLDLRYQDQSEDSLKLEIEFIDS